MLYAILITLFVLLGLAHNAPVSRRQERRHCQPFRLASTPAERRAGRESRALKWN